MIPMKAHNDAAILSPSQKRGALKVAVAVVVVLVDTFPFHRKEDDLLLIEGEEERQAVQKEENYTPALYQGDPFCPTLDRWAEEDEEQHGMAAEVKDNAYMNPVGPEDTVLVP
jgi:hypothetical protein